MARKMLLFVVVVLGVVALGGVASAEEPVLALYSSDTAINQSAADPGLVVGQGQSWQEREALETGSMPALHSKSPELRCCEGDSGPTQGWAGETVLRPEIDAGP